MNNNRCSDNVITLNKHSNKLIMSKETFERVIELNRELKYTGTEIIYDDMKMCFTLKCPTIYPDGGGAVDIVIKGMN